MNLNKLFDNLKPGEMTTIAGAGMREGIPAKEADAGWPLGILRWNKTGELLINDYHMHIVWRIDHDGILHRFAGTGVPGYSGDGGPAIDAEFYSPHDIAQDVHGNIVINDIQNFVYRRIDADTGIVDTVVGSGKKGRGGHGGPATEAEMDTHCGVASRQERRHLRLQRVDQQHQPRRRRDRSHRALRRTGGPTSSIGGRRQQTLHWAGPQPRRVQRRRRPEGGRGLLPP